MNSNLEILVQCSELNRFQYKLNFIGKKKFKFKKYIQIRQSKLGLF